MCSECGQYVHFFRRVHCKILSYVENNYPIWHFSLQIDVSVKFLFSFVFLSFFPSFSSSLLFFSFFLVSLFVVVVWWTEWICIFAWVPSRYCHGLWTDSWAWLSKILENSGFSFFVFVRFVVEHNSLLRIALVTYSCKRANISIVNCLSDLDADRT